MNNLAHKLRLMQMSQAEPSPYNADYTKVVPPYLDHIRSRVSHRQFLAQLHTAFYYAARNQ